MAKNTDFPTPVVTNVRTVRYKLFHVPPTLRQYLEENLRSASVVGGVLHNALTGPPTPLHLLVQAMLQLDVQKAAANLSGFLALSAHKHRDLTEKEDDSELSKRLKELKRLAAQLRAQGQLPLPCLQPLAADRPRLMQVLLTALSALSSWHACNTRTRDHFVTATTTYQVSLAQVQQQYSQEWACFQSWLTHCEGQNWFRLTAGVIAAIERRKLHYNRREIMDSLTALFPQWQQYHGDETLLAYLAGVCLAERRLTRLRAASTWTPPGANGGALWFAHGLPRFELRWLGDAPEFTLHAAGTAHVVRPCRRHDGSSPNAMLSQVQVQLDDNDRHLLTFVRHGRTQTALCKALALTPRGRDWFVQLALHVPSRPAVAPYAATVVSNHRETRGLLVADYGALNKAFCYFAAAPRPTDGPPPPLRVMGVDLGMARLAAYAVMDAATTAPVRVASGFVDREDATTRQHVNAELTLWYELQTQLRDARRAGGTLELRQKWQTQANELKRRLGELQQRQLFRLAPTGAWLLYLKLLRVARRVLMSLHCLGRDPNHPAPDHARLFPTLLRQFRTFRDNLLKKIVDAVAKTARVQGAHIVVIEDLTHFKFSTKLAGRDNDMLSLWSPRAVAQALRNRLSLDGIGLGEVDPRHTSQLDYQTMAFGFRDRRNLWVERAGEIVRLHADEAAAHNITMRYITRYVHLTHCWARQCGAELVLTTGGGETPGPRLRGAVLFTTNGQYQLAGLRPTLDGGFELYGVSPQAYAKLLKAATGPQFELYRHGSRYYRRPQHEQLRKVLEDAARLQVSPAPETALG
jgi:IS605 OrfB family transposase